MDSNEVSVGTRVGLAMKGVLPKYLERGSIITDVDNNLVLEQDDLEDIELKLAAFGKSPVSGDRIHLMSGLFDSPGIITGFNANKLSIKSDKSFPYYPGIKMTFLDLNKKPVIIGSKIK